MTPIFGLRWLTIILAWVALSVLTLPGCGPAQLVRCKLWCGGDQHCCAGGE